MHSAILRARCTPVASSRHEQPRPVVPDAIRSSRRSVLLGFAGLGTLAMGAGQVQAAPLAGLVQPLVLGMDSNGDGVLSVDEIRGAMQRSGGQSMPRENVINDVMSVVDFNNDANVSVDEFSRGVALELEVDERWMRTMEADGAAGVSADELAAGLGDLGGAGKEVLRVAFEMADANRDGRLNQEEAGHAMNMIAHGVLGDYYGGL